jgi:FtsP/CotA-like multicopper oxidase with cupredoxin domain
LMMSAPLIIRDRADAPLDEQEVVVILNDFTFRDPAEILSGLHQGGIGHMDHSAAAPGTSMPGPSMPGMDMGGMSMGGMSMMDGHFNDIDFDAYLANDRNLDDPEVFQVARDGRIRLRVINAAGSTNFMIDLGSLIGELIAVDGRPVVPLRARQFPLAMAQRADIRLLPGGTGAWPILFQREGAMERTGIVLATPGATIARLGGVAAESAPDLARLPGRILQPLSGLPKRKADRRVSIELAGNMMSYSWSLPQPGSSGGYIEGQRGQRIEIEMINRSDMSHPMHLHGHHFQVVALDGRAVDGAVRDTELVPVNGRTTIAFDADNPGRWMFHCHNLYHMLSGMMTEVRYI